MPFAISGGTLDAAIHEFEQQGATVVHVSADVAGNTAVAGVSGEFSLSEALARLLAGTGLEAIAHGQGFMVVRRTTRANGGPRPGNDASLGQVTVTGRRDLPAAYAGGQVARGGRVGLLGDQDFVSTPFSTQSYTQQTIIDLQAQKANDVLRSDPSYFAMTSPETTTGERALLRGFYIENAASWNYDGLAGLGSQRASAIEPFERVELLKGANALLNGQPWFGGLGGAVNLVSKKAGEAPFARLNASYQSRSQYGLHLDASQRFGRENAFGLRLNLSTRDGHTELAPQRVGARVFSLVGDYRGEHVRGFLSVVSDALSVDGTTQGVSVPAGLAIPAPPEPGNSYNARWATRSGVPETRIHGRVEFDLGRHTTLSFAHGRFRYLNGHGFDGSYTLTGNDGSALLTTGEFRASVQRVSSDISLRSRFSTGPVSHRLSLAANRFNIPYYYYGDDSGYYGPAGGASYPTNIYRPVETPQPTPKAMTLGNYKGPLMTSLALADVIGLMGDRLLLTLGARQQHVQSTDYDKSALTPSLAALYKLAPWASVYGSYIEGLEQGPTAPDRGVVNPREVFPPSHTRQFEIGTKIDLGQFALTTALFDIRQPNALQVPTANPLLNRFTVDGVQRNRGLEVSLFGEPVKGLRVMGGYAFLDARQLRTQDATLAGKRVSGPPKHSLSLTGEWDIPGAPGLTLTARALAVSAITVDADESRTIPAYQRYDLGARWSVTLMRHALSLRLMVQNLGNANQWVSGGNGYLLQGQPRTVMASASVDF